MKKKIMGLVVCLAFLGGSYCLTVPQHKNVELVSYFAGMYAEKIGCGAGGIGVAGSAGWALGSVAGSWAGGYIGGAIGASIGGPIGCAIGIKLGSQMGRYAGAA
jgi:hypothetical protein